MGYPEPFQKLLEGLCRLPGIGPKSAQRLAFYLLNRSREEVVGIARVMVEAKDKLSYCRRCGCLTDVETCSFCRDARREQEMICVVQEPRDVLVLERTGQFRGLYHVLHGALSPLDGIGPEELRLPQLAQRIRAGNIREMIIATNPNVEGDATAAYIAQLAKPLGVKVTRIAFGLPVGGDLEYADDLTLSRALEGRREM